MTMLERKRTSLSAAQKKLRTLARPLLDRAVPAAVAALPAKQRKGEIKGKVARTTPGDPASAARLAKVITLADSQSARIIGVTGVRVGVGVSVIARQLAAALGSFGRQTLLADLSRAEFSFSADKGRAEAEVDLLAMATEIAPDVGLVDLANGPEWTLSSLGALRRCFERATQKGQGVVVVDLPPVMQPDGHPSPAMAGAAAACDMVFLVCLSGRTKRRELTNAVDACNISGTRLGGLILNDWRLPASGLLE